MKKLKQWLNNILRMFDRAGLNYTVVDGRSGNAVAAFLLREDAQKYVAYRRSIEGTHGPLYDIMDAKGVVSTPVAVAPGNLINTLR